MSENHPKLSRPYYNGVRIKEYAAFNGSLGQYVVSTDPHQEVNFVDNSVAQHVDLAEALKLWAQKVGERGDIELRVE